MRSVGVSDLDLAARAVMAVPPNERVHFIEVLLEDTHVSDLWRKRYGNSHPSGGTGSLFAQASLHPTSTSNRADQTYCEALSLVLKALNAWRARTH